MRLPFVAGFAVLFLAGSFFFSGHNSMAPGVQPIAFNHSKHLASGMSCTDCHVGAEAQAHATLPTLATCLTCHENALTESSEEKKLRAFAAAKTELAWNPLTRVPAHVYFSHRRHVQIAGLKCAECHGAMEKLTAPPQKLFRPLTMDNCLQCHQQKQARTDCNDCHR